MKEGLCVYLTVTDSAKERLAYIQEKNDGNLALSYGDLPGGYACGIRGTFSLKLVTSDNEDLDTKIDSNIGDIPVQSAHLDDLNENMKLDYKKENNTLILKGDNGTISPNLSVLDNEDNKLY